MRRETSERGGPRGRGRRDPPGRFPRPLRAGPRGDPHADKARRDPDPRRPRLDLSASAARPALPPVRPRPRPLRQGPRAGPLPRRPLPLGPAPTPPGSPGKARSSTRPPRPPSTASSASRPSRGTSTTGPSWLDGAPSMILDYRGTSRIYGNYRDEIREVAPGLYLGLMYDRTTAPASLKRYFAFDSQTLDSSDVHESHRPVSLPEATRRSPTGGPFGDELAAPVAALRGRGRPPSRRFGSRRGCAR